MNEYKCSVIISTYNGEKFIQKQLISIKEQTMPAYEVLISDDNSTDSTAKIIEKFISENYLYNWKFQRNLKNKGYYRNFMSLAASAEGDLIFFCDQDDIWKLNKIERLEKYFENNGNVSVVSSNVDFIDSDDNEIEYNDYFTTKNEYCVEIEDILYTSPILGCSMAFKKSFLNYLKLNSLTMEFGSHDTLLTIIGALNGNLYRITDNLIYYRIHGANTSISRECNNLITRQNENKSKTIFLSDLKNNIEWSRFGDSKGISMLDNALKVCEIRTSCLSKKSFINYLKAIISCKKYVVYTRSQLKGIRLLLGDIYCSLRG